ncbi:hypothetical protein ACFYP4_02365 [Streptomyces sp. NPDC005551]|uniref:hypothetical protein n=1 Tax=Streptomyces sp. NPDC005551 TaxID=3364725 RepID=UPI003697410D
MTENKVETPDTRAITFTMTVTPSDKALQDVFQTALEGGIGYWSTCSAYKWENLAPSEVHAVVHDSEDEDKEYRITLETIREGLRNIVTGQVKRHKDDEKFMAYLRALAVGILIDEDYDYDAGDADNIVQAGLFKEIVYG